MQWLRQKVVAPILSQLKQGADPRKLAWSVSLAAAIALIPIMGATTFLCGIVGAALRLNHVAMQTVNYLLYAPQLLLIPVFIRLGEKIMGAPTIAIDLGAMKNQFMADPGAFFRDFGMAGVHGVIAWALILPLPTWILARGLEAQFRRFSQRR
jgi:Uncharacterized protein conserved in bacteria (DUF2062)